MLPMTENRLESGRHFHMVGITSLAYGRSDAVVVVGNRSVKAGV